MCWISPRYSLKHWKVKHLKFSFLLMGGNITQATTLLMEYTQNGQPLWSHRKHLGWRNTSCKGAGKILSVLLEFCSHCLISCVVHHGCGKGRVASFGWSEIWLVRLLFLAGTVFFSHNISASVFSQFQPSCRLAKNLCHTPQYNSRRWERDGEISY